MQGGKVLCSTDQTEINTKCTTEKLHDTVKYQRQLLRAKKYYKRVRTAHLGTFQCPET